MIETKTAEPAPFTRNTLARIRTMALTMPAGEIASALQWQPDRVYRTARAHGIEICESTPHHEIPIVPVEIVEDVAPSRHRRTRGGEPRSESISIALRVSNDAAIRRECFARKFPLSGAVNNLIAYAEQKELWDEILK